jgi:hypothetical protein
MNLGYVIQNEDLSLEITIFFFFIHIWHMPLFFFLAGMSTFYSLNFRTEINYVKDRFKRLFLPFLFGIFIVVPPIVYYEQLTLWGNTKRDTAKFYGSYFEFYPHFFEWGTFHWYHLWFILYLFIISLIALPLFLNLKIATGKQQSSMIAQYFGKGKRILLFALPLILINVSLRRIFPGNYSIINDWAQIFSYFVLFIYGFLIVGDIRFEKSFSRNKTLALVLAVITSFLVLVILIYSFIVSNNSSINKTNDTAMSDFIGNAIFWTLFSFCGWCWLITFFGYGRNYLTKKYSLISHLNEIALPFYILHHTAIIIIGFYVLQWGTTVLGKYLIITSSALFITLLLCELIKTNNITRIIFGMRPKAKKKNLNNISL